MGLKFSPAKPNTPEIWGHRNTPSALYMVNPTILETTTHLARIGARLSTCFGLRPYATDYSYSHPKHCFAL
jgi:hypothetical protein